jgi:nitrate reductase NapAB chaperone NapD
VVYQKNPYFHHLVPFLTAIIVFIACLQQLEPLKQLDESGNLCLVFEGQDQGMAHSKTELVSLISHFNYG